MHFKCQVALLLCIALTAIVTEAFPQADTDRPAVSDEALESTLKDKRYLMRQLKCALGEAPCDPVGRRLKSLAPLVLQGSCAQCSPKELNQIRKVLSYMQINFPKEWNKVLKQYSR
ncbi:ejaculatory bulb-specific protein 3-like [Anoplophora glabripennis]|uniref:Chemosensory protein n=1 Tax=Anoplophora chinensis TaxID=217632 RepID=A0A2H4ZB68_ANOCN|nr:ejaculatory bulb-specific protein 3-like [Anoplophora glabripennis]AUF72996.1 chemosensory protein [Anoplophora chinensis]